MLDKYPKLKVFIVFPEFNLFPQNKIFCNITKSFFGRQIRPKMLKQFQKIGKKYSYQIFVKYGMVGKATVCFGYFTLEGGGSRIPKSKCQKGDKILTFFVKTKYGPYGLECKINPKNLFN